MAKWITEITGIGGGDDPIGFLLASYEMLIRERKEMQREIVAIKMDNDRLVALMGSARQEVSEQRGTERDLGEEMFQLSNEIARKA